MKLVKKELVNLSSVEHLISDELTPQIAGGTSQTIRWTVTIVVTIIPGDDGNPGQPTPPPPPEDPITTYPGVGLPPY